MGALILNGNAPDREVQRFLAQGVKIMDGLEKKMPLGLSANQRQVRDRCDELAKSMERVLDRRPDDDRRVRHQAAETRQLADRGCRSVARPGNLDSQKARPRDERLRLDGT